MSLRFDGRVAIVTGAGGGLGRTYALELAKRGAKVVVNDLGGDGHGTSSSTSMADKVVGEIKAAGGQAAANYDSVENGDKIVKTAIDNFGRVDIVINNAGILRDIAFVNMTDNDWDLIFKVHVKGAYAVTKAAWPYFRKQNYGRVIVTSSNAGVYGNFGQTNYAAAKAALIGFSNSLALEGAKYGIIANALIPTAGSRLTQTVMPQEMVDALKPEYVTPLTLLLCHESNTETGGIFEAGGQWYGQVQFVRSNGKIIPGATLETLQKQWPEFTNMNNAKHFGKIGEVTLDIMTLLNSTGGDEGSAAAAAGGDSGFPENLSSSGIFDEINRTVKEEPELVKSVKAVILYVVTKNGKEEAKFTLDFKNEPFSVYLGEPKGSDKPAATVTVEDDDFLKIVSGELNPQKAFMSGKIKVRGNVMLLQKLSTVLQRRAKL